jgi:hypothetical protein
MMTLAAGFTSKIRWKTSKAAVSESTTSRSTTEISFPLLAKGERVTMVSDGQTEWP